MSRLRRNRHCRRASGRPDRRRQGRFRSGARRHARRSAAGSLVPRRCGLRWSLPNTETGQGGVRDSRLRGRTRIVPPDCLGGHAGNQLGGTPGRLARIARPQQATVAVDQRSPVPGVGRGRRSACIGVPARQRARDQPAHGLPELRRTRPSERLKEHPGALVGGLKVGRTAPAGRRRGWRTEASRQRRLAALATAASAASTPSSSRTGPRSPAMPVVRVVR